MAGRACRTVWPMSSTSPATGGRQQRRRVLTRARLLGAARELMARRGVDAVGVSEIAEAADLGAGTFYNYFRSRDDVVAALMAESIETVGDALDRLTAEMPDPAEVFAASLRHLVRQAVSDPMWGWFVVRLGVAHPQLIEILGPRAARDLRRGVEQGRFEIPDVEVATSCTFGALISTLHLVLTAQPRQGIDELFAQTMLTMVGLTAQDASEVAARPLPPLPAPRAGLVAERDGL